ncbi:MAG: radical SAM protein [Pedosphaera sp.]|nr:radical SAM protein [Pedosphaera sp.]
MPNTLSAVQDHTRVFGDLAYVYPVISRRSRGLSIGINLNPDKKCNFDCVYCEVDRRTPGLAARVDLEQLKDELRWLIRFARDGELGKRPKFNEVPDLTRSIRDLAFSGDGEPTMVSNFDACVRAVIEIRELEKLRDAKLVLITDAAGLDKATVKAGLALMDQNNGEIWGKLDAGTPEYFRQVNRSTIPFERILKNLLETSRVRPIVIQSLFLKIHGQAISEGELAAYCERLNAILRDGGKICEVHAYTIARPTPEAWATRLETVELNTIAQTIRNKTGLSVEVFD